MPPPPNNVALWFYSMYIHMYLVFVELMQLADKHCEVNLVKRCETLIIRGIMTDNVLSLIALATNFNLKV